VPRLLVCYHFLHPNAVVSARMFTQLAEEQAQRGWTVTALTSNRAFDDPRVRYPARELHRDVDIVRVGRPPLDQRRPLPRLANSAWMIGAWALRAPALPVFDAAIVGSDPAFAALLGAPLRALRPRAAIFHWCFDLYPEAIEAEGITAALGPIGPAAAGAMKRVMSAAYRAYTAVVDIGPCMRARLDRYAGVRQHETLTPWALSEVPSEAPLDATVDSTLLELRRRLFPRARLGLLYAGSMGRAHEFRALLALARACRARSGDDVGFCFVASGNRFEELRAEVTPADSNVHFAPFTGEEALADRLQAADLHLVSLKPDWVGLVVPSKFFAALAAGRPVLFAGPASSAIASWISEHDVGLVLAGADLAPAHLAPTVESLHRLMAEPERLAAWQRRARKTYQERFSRRVINDRWDRLLRTNVST
jgi:glycosyltransferase involved in cell wall biosynthesis